jgi:hypothetical protein
LLLGGRQLERELARTMCLYLGVASATQSRSVQPSKRGDVSIPILPR